MTSPRLSLRAPVMEPKKPRPSPRDRGFFLSADEWLDAQSTHAWPPGTGYRSVKKGGTKKGMCRLSAPADYRTDASRPRHRESPQKPHAHDCFKNITPAGLRTNHAEQRQKG